MSEKKRIVVIHGYGANPGSHWFNWLREQLPSVSVEIPTLEDSMSPDYDSWLATATESVADADSGTVVIGHSLGAVTLLHALDALPRDRRLAGIVLVAGFAEALPGYEALDPFTSAPLEVERLRQLSAHRSVFVSDDDAIVAPAITARLAQRLDGELITVAGAGHFQESDGKTEFPELLSVLEKSGIQAN